MFPICIPYAADFHAAFFTSNLFTAIAYTAISALVMLAPRGILREDYRPLFAAFIGACGAHHWGHALGAPSLLQVFLDVGTALISICTAAFLILDVSRDLLHARAR